MDLPIEFLGKLDIPMLLAIAGMFWVFNSRLDKKFDRIDISLKNLDSKIDKNKTELDAKIDKNDDRLTSIEKEIGQLNTKMAVIESRLSDISTNVTHLMWQNQIFSAKEDQKEN